MKKLLSTCFDLSDTFKLFDLVFDLGGLTHLELVNCYGADEFFED